jgi:pyridoxine 5-phosphate synthase
VNAGHDLNQQNLGPFLQAVPGVLEVSIGHAVVCESLDHGLEATLERYLAIVADLSGATGGR